MTTTITPEDMFERCMQEFRKGGQPTAVPYPWTFADICAVPEHIGGEKFSQANRSDSPYIYKWVVFLFFGSRCEAIVRMHKATCTIEMMFRDLSQIVKYMVLFDPTNKKTDYVELTDVKQVEAVTGFFFGGYCVHYIQTHPDEYPCHLSEFLQGLDFCSDMSIALSQAELCTAPHEFWLAFLDWVPPQ